MLDVPHRSPGGLSLGLLRVMLQAVDLFFHEASICDWSRLDP